MGGADEAEAAFASFNFDSCEEWKSYLINFSFVGSNEEMEAATTKLKRRWYRKNVDESLGTAAPAPFPQPKAESSSGSQTPPKQPRASAQASSSGPSAPNVEPSRPSAALRNKSLKQILLSLDGLALIINCSVVLHCIMYFPFSLLDPHQGFVAYRRALKSALAGYALALYRAHFRAGIPPMKMETFGRILQDASSQYLMFAGALLTTEAFLALLVIIVPSWFFVGQWLPVLLEMLPSNRVFDGIQAFVQFLNTTRVKHKMLEYAALGEIGLFSALVLNFLRGDFAILATYITFVFLRYRYIFSPISRAQWSHMRLFFDQLTASPKCPSIVRTTYQRGRDKLSAWAIPTTVTQ